MPQVFKVGSYVVYFWLNEGKPLEPVHVHVNMGIPSNDATKIWLTKTGKTLLCNNNSRIPANKLKIIMEVIEARHKDIAKKWIEKFGQISFYC